MEKMLNYNIAILITCYNRKQKTLSFLESLVKQDQFKEFNVDIYLLDDNSSDGTGLAVTEKYPFINVVKGKGNLFWAGGMRVIWKHAMSVKDYDLYFLFNDDVVLTDNAFRDLLMCYTKLDKKEVVLIGSTLSAESNETTYGGLLFNNIKRWNWYRATPHDTELITCPCGNANILVVDKHTIKKIGIFSADYVHSYEDFEYTLTAYKSGVNVFLAPGYYGYCENDHGLNWLSGKSHSLKKRIEYLYSPKGLAYHDHLYFIRRHFPADYLMAFVKLWLKTIFPLLWDKFKVKENH